MKTQEKMEAEIRVMHLQTNTRSCWWPLKLRESHRNRYYLKPGRRYGSAKCLDFKYPASTTMRIDVCCLNYPVCGRFKE